MLAADRHLAALEAVGLFGHLLGRDQIAVADLLQQRLVLVLGEESSLIAESQIHRVLDGRHLVLVVPLGPGHHGAFVHSLAILAVELGRLAAVAVAAKAVCAEFGIPCPKGLVRGKGVDHLGPLALPLGMLLAVENVVGHVARADHRTAENGGDLLPRAGHAQDVAGQQGFPAVVPHGGPGRFGRLRIVEHRQGRRVRSPADIPAQSAVEQYRESTVRAGNDVTSEPPTATIRLAPSGDGRVASRICGLHFDRRRSFVVRPGALVHGTVIAMSYTSESVLSLTPSKNSLKIATSSSTPAA
ncbi:MAG: hypothetical protein NTW96_26455 [Planctomycetia bacterium]|nr:hypothetical protein [Planctomycetia bacterium]